MLFITGCGGSLKNSWTNFTAYYNTYYNAKQDFEDGIALVDEQPVNIDPSDPVRPHPAPDNVGVEYFEAAIDNGALILRRFSDSKWTDDALLLMGKSYYYLQEFFLARQNFDELLELTASALKKEAIIWKARTMLDTGSFTEGIQFLEKQLENEEVKWDSNSRAEAQVLLAQHMAMQKNWDGAVEILEDAVPSLKSQELKGRSYFLWGQALETQGELIRAYQVYDNVKRYFLDYEYLYWAEMKQAQVSRKGGRNELAAAIYNNLLRDDKSYDRRNAIQFELAQTYAEQGNYKQAEAAYREILETNTRNGTRQLLADTYYQLGELYSNYYSNYSLAAAYYDSSSTLSVQAPQATGENANLLAEAYNRYATLQDEIARIDSLLTLGSLSDEQLQARLNTIRQERLEVMQESQPVVQQTRNTLANSSEPEMVTSATSMNDQTAAFGFLNYRNENLLSQGQQAFIATWGQRPLVDDWRRREAILNKNVENAATKRETDTVKARDTEALNDKTLGIDLEEIPRTRKDRAQLKQRQLNTFYKLGSLFFLSLNQPDSAATYYRKILERSPDSELEAQTLYSMHELYQSQQMPDSAAFFREKILNQYPQSRYAARIEVQIEGENSKRAEKSTENVRQRALEIISSENAQKPSRQTADKLRELAIQDSSNTLAPALYFEAIREQIRYAHSRDSVTTASDSLDQQMYAGAEWNKVREMAAEFTERYPTAKQTPKVEGWLSVLQGYKNANMVLTCSQLGVEPQMIPTKQKFVEAINLPAKVERMNISGQITYRLRITPKGKVASLELLSNPSNLGIEEAYEKAILNDLRFEPISYEGQAVEVNCDIEFPISR